MVSTAVKTIDDVFVEVRILLNDVGVNGQPYRYSVASLLAIFNTALREVFTLRPDAYIGNFSTGVLSNNLANTYVLADLGLGLAFPLDDRFFYAPVVAYVAGKAEFADDEFTENSRAVQLLAAFRAQLTGQVR